MNLQETKNAMNQLKKDWDDISARSHVSEVGLDLDRADLIRRYRQEERLSQRQIAEALHCSQQTISDILNYKDYMSTSSDGTRLTRRRFLAYWKQISDPKMTKGRRELDLNTITDPDRRAAALVRQEEYRVYKAACHADIRKLVEAGKSPAKRGKKPLDHKPAKIQTVKQLARAVREIRQGPLAKELARLKRLLHAERSTYAPDQLAGAAVVIEREMARLDKLLAGIGKNFQEPGQPTEANAGA